MMHPAGPQQLPFPEPDGSRRWGRGGLIIAVVTAAVVVMVAVMVAVVVTVRVADRFRSSTYKIGTPAQAGGLRLQAPGAKSVGPSSPDSENLQKILGSHFTTAANAGYEDQRGNVVILEIASGDLGDPADLVKRIRANPPKVTGGSPHLLFAVWGWKTLAETDPGPHGGKAACGRLTLSSLLLGGSFSLPITKCFWQTKHTYGSLMVSDLLYRPSPTEGQLAVIMRRMRADLEKPT